MTGNQKDFFSYRKIFANSLTNYFLNISVYGTNFSLNSVQEYLMKNSADKIVEVPVERNLAIIKRIDELPGRNKPGKPKSQEIVKGKKENLFTTWMMPEEPEGYIKAKANDFL